ncbi:adenosine deaminase-like protein [Lentinula aciculospora]|uniref:Adenosine deaminase-like protein n=1 Tax=Lentinula aciculospora TaxID=153920 RepID=A0A9W9DRC1_9AGAR|nr:adenosine deaminase-like protein [Lentinula aciculospora]
MPSSTIAGPALAALSSLTPNQLIFIKSLPKAELHAHLNGCVPLSVLHQLAETYDFSKNLLSREEILSGLQTLENFSLDDIHSFFGAFRVIYALISTREALATATRAVLAQFLDDSSNGFPECTYLELRTTPRPIEMLSATEYLDTVLKEVEKYPSNRAALILSLDRRMPVNDDEGKGAAITVGEVIDHAIRLKKEGRRVVGVDLCGDPLAGDMSLLEPFITKAQATGLRITLHIAETTQNSASDTLQLLAYSPSRLGHATFLNEEAKEIVLKQSIAVELCLSSNIICKTVPSLSSHHIGYYLERNHPIAVCTDDTLPFRTSLTAEYALLLASPPLGLGLSQTEVEKIARNSLEVAFLRMET